MAERLNRDPTYDLARHLTTGETGPLSGSPTMRQYDAELDRNDPMDPYTAGVGENITYPRSMEAMRAMDAGQAAGLDSGNGKKDEQAIDMSVANNCDDEPSKGGIQYGPRFTGGY